ncbi:MAG: hypothetical protein R2747_05185 [Pyrinomonadaceae bacterium]
MKTAAQIGQLEKEAAGEKNFAIDTSFVLFFLAIEFGQSFGGFGFESVFLGLTLLMVAVLPYFTFIGEKPEFGNWLFGRSLILGFAIVLGLIFKSSLGIVLPEEMRFLPMTLLIGTALLSCYIQFYGFLKLRLAK